MDAQQSRQLLTRHLVRNYQTPIAALSYISFVSQTPHQFVPGVRDAEGADGQPDRCRCARLGLHNGHHLFWCISDGSFDGSPLLADISVKGLDAEV